MRVLLLPGLVSGVLILLGTVAAIAGPWPREKGKVFLSVSTETRVNTENLLIRPEYDGSLYAEYGLGRRLTFGVDAYRGPSDETWLFFLSRTLTPADARHQFAARLGLGTRSTDDTGGGDLVLVGASWGMGFETRWGPGWATVDGQVRQRGSGGQETKLDATLGLWPRETWAAILQVQASEYPGSEPTARLQATAVRKLNARLSLESGVTYGILNDTRAGLKLAIWAEF